MYAFYFITLGIKNPIRTTLTFEMKVMPTVYTYTKGTDYRLGVKSAMDLIDSVTNPSMSSVAMDLYCGHS